ncbi:hypothetical protein SAMN04489711_1425 [Paracidovorax wautersii]|uniref:Uncharacterized protein n=1 Tax=Paracidovorax wautersii TaxID=1177982 RepID=A0A1I2I149_9BURK|nr:hypothetical protein SAMN04489711_1425 [Paracidovorax wautersii]
MAREVAEPCIWPVILADDMSAIHDGAKFDVSENHVGAQRSESTIGNDISRCSRPPQGRVNALPNSFAHLLTD